MSLCGNLRTMSRSPTVQKSFAMGNLIAAGYSPPASGAAVTEESARKLSAVDRCLEILSDSMSKLPHFLMDGHTRERLRDHPLLYLLNVRPNEAMTPSVRKKSLELSRLIGGNGYDWIVRDERTGRIRELIPVPYQLVEPWKDQSGRIWYTVMHPLTGEPMVLPNEDICHYKGTSTNGLKGVGVLRRAAEVIATAKAAQEYELAYYESGGQPSGVLMANTDLGGYVQDVSGNPVRDEDGNPIRLKDDLRAQWEKIHAGPKNAHRVAVLDHGLKYEAITLSHEDAQFVQSKEVSIRDIARYFGIPLYKLQEGHQAYNSNEQNAIEYVVGTLHPIVTQYEEEQTYKLLTASELSAAWELRINLMAELKGDTASRAAWYTAMADLSAFCPNDILALEDMPNVPGGDQRRASLNYVPLDLWADLSRRRAEQYSTTVREEQFEWNRY